MAEPNLKLVKIPERGALDPLPFEKRRAERHRVTGRATAVSKSELDDQLDRIRSLQITNMSDTGLGAVCQDPLPLNSIIAVFIPPHGPERGLDVYGRVVRCTPKDYGHEIGIQFNVKAAA